MKAHTASLFNALILIGLSAYGYFASETPSVTALIPSFFGIALIAMYPGVKKENKVIAHIAVTLTLIILIALIKPLTGALGKDKIDAVARIAIMMISTVTAMVFFIKSFVEARKNKETN